MNKDPDIIEPRTPNPEPRTPKYWFNPTQPLWLPPGTVRALLVLGLTWSVILIMAKFAVMQEDIPPGVKEVMMALLPAIVLLIKDYISIRSNGQSQNPTQSQ